MRFPPRRRASELILYTGIVPAALLWLTPLWMILTYSTAPPAQFYDRGVLWVPSSNFLTNLRVLLDMTPFMTALLNSLRIAIITAALSAVFSCMAGYSLSQLSIPASRWLVASLIATLGIPYIVLTLPQFVMMARIFHGTNHWAAVVLPSLCNASSVFFMRQSFLSLPREIFDGARVEGVGEMKLLFYVAMPLALPAVATVSIVSFVQSWNNYLWPMLILSAPEHWTAPVALGSLVGSLDRVMWGAIMVGTLVMTAPVMLIFLLLQRYIISGFAASGPLNPSSLV